MAEKPARLLMPKGEAARYLMTSPEGLDEMGIPAKVHPRRRTPVYDRRDLDAWADNLPYEGETEGDGTDEEGNTCQADAVFG